MPGQGGGKLCHEIRETTAMGGAIQHASALGRPDRHEAIGVLLHSFKHIELPGRPHSAYLIEQEKFKYQGK